MTAASPSRDPSSVLPGGEPEGDPPLAPSEQRRLLDAAIDALRDRLTQPDPNPTTRPPAPAARPDTPAPRTPGAPTGTGTPTGAEHALDAPGASFVTLRDGDRLLGCIGSLEPRRALLADVVDNALGAAFRDPRLPPLTAAEFARMRVHISVLTPAVPLPATSLEDLRARLRPGTDGLVVSSGRHRATFLPSVWEQLPDPDEFLAHLWRKAGLRPDAWPAGIMIERYATFEFGDDGPRPPIGT